MLTEVRHQAIVQPGGTIQVGSLDLPPGTTVEVIILYEKNPDPTPLTHFIGAAAGSFADPQAVDAFIRQERDSWDS